METIDRIFEDRENFKRLIRDMIKLKGYVAEVEAKYLSMQEIHLSGICKKNCLVMTWSEILEIKIITISLSNAYDLDLAATMGDRHRPEMQDSSLIVLSDILRPVYKKVVLCHERHKRHLQIWSDLQQSKIK